MKRLRGLMGPWDVRYAKSFVDEAGKELLGQCDKAGRVIRMRSGQHPLTHDATLWHEWLHGVLWDAGVHLKPDLAERVCDSLSSGLVAARVAPPFTKRGK